MNKENLYSEQYEKYEEKPEKREKTNNEQNSAKIDSELESLYQRLSKNLEENSQLNDLFLRFFQSKTKLAFLLEEKDYQLLLMKFLAFFNEMVSKINSNSSQKTQFLPQKTFDLNMENIQTSPSQTDYFPINSYNYDYTSPFNYPMNFNPNFNYPSGASPMKINDMYNYTGGASPRKNHEKKQGKNTISPEKKDKNNNFYGDLTQSNFIYTKVDPNNKKEYCIFKKKSNIFNLF